MSLPTSKELKAFAAACRKAGIKSFKNADFEFTLTDEAPRSRYPKRKSTKAILNNTPDNSDPLSEFKSDELSEDALLMWSAGEETPGIN